MNFPSFSSFLPAGVRLAALVCTFVLSGCATPPPPPPPPVYAGPVLQIEQTERGVLMVLPGTVLFEVNQSAFREAVARPYLDRLADLVTRKSTKRLAIEGHTDADGSAVLNDALSKARATAVADAMVARGVQRERIDIAGYSFNRPVASNATDEGKRLNRRVEMIVLDETVGNITAGEPAGAFESAFARLKQLVESGQVRPVEASKP